METNHTLGYFTFTFLLVIQIILLLLLMGSVFVGLASGNLFFDHINAITIGSLVFFIIMFLAGCVSTKLYFTSLVFQIIAFPSAIDNLIPGVYQGELTELNASIFPLFTHIDIYLLLGILKGIRKKDKVILPTNKFLLLSVIVLFLSSIVNLFYSRNTQDFLLVIAGFIHLRYLIWFYILFSFLSPVSYTKAIINGLILSVIFLFIEAIVFTKMIGADRLSSGTLGNNSFGNIIACITVYFIFVLKNDGYRNRALLIVGIFIGITTVILTGTRMAIFGGFTLFFIGIYFHNRKSFLQLLYVLLVSAGLILVAMSTDVYKKNIPKRFDIEYLTSKIHFNLSEHGRKIIEIEPSWETNSLLTRVKLYDASLEMIIENPFFGIGSMRWNYHKNYFGFDEEILLDTHNGYLAILSQFGLLSVFFIFFIYFLPIKLLKDKDKYNKGGNDQYAYLALISVGMAVADLSNAGIYKHQIYGLLCLIIMLLLSNKART